MFKIKNQTHLLQDNDFYIIPPYSPHCFKIYDDKPYNYNTVCIVQDNIKPPYFIKKLDNYIETYGFDGASSAGAADYFNMSKYHFIRQFKLNTGLTPSNYISALRIKKAQMQAQH